MNGYLMNDTRFISTFITASTFGRCRVQKWLELLPHWCPRPIDEKKLDFQTAFLEVGTGMTQLDQVQSRETRKEYVRPPDRCSRGPQCALSFDGFKVKAGVGSWQIDGFACALTWTSRGF